MPSSRINFNHNLPAGAAAWGVINATLNAWYTVQRIKAEMDSITGTGPADYTKLAVPFGLDLAADAGLASGTAFYNTVAGLKANLDIACAFLKDVDQII